MSGHLELLDEGREVELAGESMVVGREADCDVVVQNPAVSRHHVRLTNDGVEWLAEDLGSRHGTLLNGAPMAANQPVSLRDRDQLEVAGTTIVFHAEQPTYESEERTSFLAQQVVADMLGSLSGRETSPYLRVLNGFREGERIVLDGTRPYLILGRSDDCDVPLDDANVSRRHCRVSIDYSGIWAEDLGSKNGILLNGQVADGKVRLKDRCELAVGGVRMMFVDPAAAVLGDLDESGTNRAIGAESDDDEDDDDDESSVIEEDHSLASLSSAESVVDPSDSPRMALDEAGDWSRSVPALDALDATVGVDSMDDTQAKDETGLDPIVLGIFASAVLALVGVIIYLLLG
jgi:pSer/pThr/pTyr-binding forkhead associated (FHA) protein